jgi:hypothetical protein
MRLLAQIGVGFIAMVVSRMVGLTIMRPQRPAE